MGWRGWGGASSPRGRRPPEALGVASGTPVGQGGVVSGGGWPLGWRCETRAISTQIAHRRKGISSRTVGTRSSSVLEQTEGGEAESEHAKNQRPRFSRQLASRTLIWPIPKENGFLRGMPSMVFDVLVSDLISSIRESIVSICPFPVQNAAYLTKNQLFYY